MQGFELLCDPKFFSASAHPAARVIAETAFKKYMDLFVDAHNTLQDFNARGSIGRGLQEKSKQARLDELADDAKVCLQLGQLALQIHTQATVVQGFTGLKHQHHAIQEDLAGIMVRLELLDRKLCRAQAVAVVVLAAMFCGTLYWLIVWPGAF